MTAYREFVGGSYTAPSILADAEMCMNLFVERNESPGARFPTFLRRRPGSDDWVSVTENPCRGEYEVDGRFFAVMGSVLYEFTEVNGVGVATSRGSVGFATTPATFASLDDQLAVTSAGSLYILTLSTNTLTLELVGATMCDFLDNFFLALDADTSTLYISDDGDGTTWDPSQFAQRTVAGDPWVAMKVVDRQIRLLGTRTSETWVNTGAFPFPFEPNQSAFIKEGTSAPWCAIPVSDVLVFITQNTEGFGMVVRSNGYSVERISTHAIEHAIQSYTTTSDAVAWSYQKDGHTFYVVNFPTEDATWAWDAATGLWHQEGYWNSLERKFEAAHAQFHVYAFGKHLVGDRMTGAISALSTTTATERDGAPIRWVRRAPTIAADNAQVFCARFEVLFEAGVGVISGQGSDPVFMLRQSNDGGKTWSPERTKKAGKGGDYSHRAQWFMNGVGRQRVWELSGTDPAPWNIMGANLDLGVGTS